MIIAMASLTATGVRCSRMYIAADGCESLLADEQRIASSKARLIPSTKYATAVLDSTVWTDTGCSVIGKVCTATRNSRLCNDAVFF